MSDLLMHRVRLISFWVTILLIVSPALLIGGTRSDVQVWMSAASLFALGCILVPRWRSTPPIPWPVWALLGLTAFTIFQTLSIPMEWLEVLSPRTASLYLAYEPDRSWAPISLAPVATTQQALLHLTIVTTLLLVLSHGRRHATAISWSIILIGAVCAAIAYLHMLLGLKQIYGFYESIHRTVIGHFFGPFVNENTMAGLLNLACLTSAGMLVGAQSTKTKNLAALAAILCSSAVFLGHSRGGQVALVIGWVLFGTLSFVVSQEKNAANRQAVRKVLGYGTILIGSGIVVTLFALNRWSGLSLDRMLEEPKFTPVMSLPQMLEDFARFGSGRGSFASVYPHYQQSDLNGFVTHPENIVVQYVSEWGVFFGSAGIVFGVCILVAGLQNVSRKSQPLQWGLWAGLMAVALQQCVDFGLESMGLALPATAALGLLFIEQRTIRRSLPHRFFWVGTTAVFGLSLFFWAPAILAHQHDERLLGLRAKASSSSTVEQRAMQLVRKNPSDYMVPLTVSDILSRSVPFDMQRFIKWNNHAQRLFPNGGQAHHLAAQALHRNGFKNQAAGEYRRAFRKQPWKRLSLIAEIVGRYNDAQLLLRAIPENRRAQRLLFATLFRLKKYEKVVEVADEVLQWSPHLLSGHIFRSRALYALKNIEALRDEIDWFMDRGHPSHAHILAAQIALIEGDKERAELHISKGLSQGGKHKIQFLRQAVRCYRQLRDINAARRMLDFLWEKSRAETNTAAETLELRASTETHIGDTAQAIESYERAYALRPRPTLVVRIARIELKLDNVDSAVRRLTVAQQRWPTSVLIKNELDALKKKTPDTNTRTRSNQD